MAAKPAAGRLAWAGSTPIGGTSGSPIGGTDGASADGAPPPDGAVPDGSDSEGSDSDGSGSALSDGSADGSSLEVSSPGWLDSPDPFSDFSADASVSDGRRLFSRPTSAASRWSASGPRARRSSP